MPIDEITPMRTGEHDGDVVDLVLLWIGAASPEEIELQPAARIESFMPLYRAMYGDSWAYVDRVLAIKLRERGAVWSGDVLRDPCAVA